MSHHCTSSPHQPTVAYSRSQPALQCRDQRPRCVFAPNRGLASRMSTLHADAVALPCSHYAGFPKPEQRRSSTEPSPANPPSPFWQLSPLPFSRPFRVSHNKRGTYGSCRAHRPQQGKRSFLPAQLEPSFLLPFLLQPQRVLSSTALAAMQEPAPN